MQVIKEYASAKQFEERSVENERALKQLTTNLNNPNETINTDEDIFIADQEQPNPNRRKKEHRK